MYWDEELRRLAVHKAELQRSIARSRAKCALAASRVVRPVEFLDRVVEAWRGLPGLVKFGAAPLGVLAARTVLPRRGILGSLVRWGPLVFSIVRGFGSGAGRDVSERRP